MSHPNIAIVGATGAVGREMLDILHRRNFPCGRITCLASPRSAGQVIEHALGTFTVQATTPESFKDVQLALFSAGSGISKSLGPVAAAAGCVVVDNSSAFRMDPAIPLIVPEVNPHHIPAAWIGTNRAGKPGCILANPNCSTIIMLVAVHPLYQAFGVERAVISTYQAASGAGAMAMEELRDQTRDVLDGKPAQPKIFKEPYAFNLFSHNSALDPVTGLNVEEQKMILESHKIWGEDSVRITAMCIRVPVLRAHCESINLTLKRDVTVADLHAALAKAPGVTIVDDRANNIFPTPLKASGGQEVLVGRIRLDPSQTPGGLNALAAATEAKPARSRGVELFVSGDQLLKGAAQNAVQIAELIFR